MEPQVFDLLLYLLKNRDRVVTKDDLIAGVWGGRIVSDSTLTSRINAARKAVGDSGEQQALIRTFPRKGFRFVGDVRVSSAASSARDGGPLAPLVPTDLHQEVQFCKTPDGVRLAYAAVGQGPPLVNAANWLRHIEYDWQSPIWSRLFRALTAEHRLVRYDERGTGLSDRDVGDISFETFVSDLESVVDAIGLDRFALFGASRGCSTCIAYAARHPERVSRVILYGGYARGRLRLGGLTETAAADALLTLFRQGFAPENRAIRQMLKYGQFPDSTTEQLEWFNNLQHITTSPENAIRIRQATFDLDVSDLLPQVTVPTLVLHCRNDPAVPFEEGRRIAAGIPGSRFVPLDGRNHLILEGEPSWGHLLNEIQNFLKN